MEDLLEICAIRDDLRAKLENFKKDALVHLSAILKGNKNTIVEQECPTAENVTPQQSLKRIKRLSNVRESEECFAENSVNKTLPKRTSNSSLLTLAESISECSSVSKAKSMSKVEDVNQTPEQLNVIAMEQTETNVAEEDNRFARPIRQSRAKAEKNLKEPKISTKLRRPNEQAPKIKQEKSLSKIQETNEKNNVEDSVVLISNNVQSVLEISEEDVLNVEEKLAKPEKQLRILVKREKISTDLAETKEKEADIAVQENQESSEPQSAIAIIAEVKSERSANLQQNNTVVLDATASTKNSTVVSDTTTNTITKESQPRKKRDKKNLYKPIKVERFSDIDKLGKAVPLENENPTALHRTRSTTNKMLNEFNNKKDDEPSDATFCTSKESKITTAEAESKNKVDETFDIPCAEAQRCSLASSQLSMETAKDTVSPVQGDSLITDDDTEIIESTIPASWKHIQHQHAKPLANKFMTSATKKHELFNPLVQSPVKMKVKAFENAVKPNLDMETANNGRTKRTKENKPLNVVSSTTPLANKHRSAVMNRFLTPNQFTNVTPNAFLEGSKKPVSASKALSVPKINKMKPLGNMKPITRENSVEEIRKLNEERKRQREQKHILAAQLRETKERERAERLAKAAKDREEKLLAKKQAEAELRKREQEEMQKKAAEAEARRKAQKAKAIAEQEREMLQQLNEPQVLKPLTDMPPPLPPNRQKYCFEMLHEDDSTDDEEKVSYKRPLPPVWSRRNYRAKPILMQQHLPACVIDHLFSVKPTTLDLRDIFPDIDKRHLKRNSSALWSTPPRYSELPKY